MERNIKRGDIYYIVGGTAVGSEHGADRPAVVVSNDIGNKYAPVVEVVYLTTGKKRRMPTHVSIGSSARPSTALCEQVVTVSKSRLQRRMGRVTEEELRQIDAALTTSLGIQERYGGFLLVKCAGCGKLRAFYPKAPINTMRCKCGFETALCGLRPLYLECGCGSKFKYMTNIKSKSVTWKCLNCGNPVRLKQNKQGSAYVTTGRKGGR